MNRRISRQVLDCGDGVREVTALALALKIPQLAADTATPTESGDCEDSVAALQDARTVIRTALGSWSQRVSKKKWRLPMNPRSTAVPKGPAAALARARGMPKQFEPLRYADVLRLVLRTQPRSFPQSVHGTDARPMLEVEALTSRRLSLEVCSERFLPG